MGKRSRRKREPRGTLTGPQYQFHQALAEEQYRALGWEPWDCALCGQPAQRFTHGFVYERTLTRAQRELLGNRDRDDLLVLGHRKNPPFAGLTDAIAAAASGGDARRSDLLRHLFRSSGPWLAYRLSRPFREIIARGRPSLEAHFHQAMPETRDDRHASGLVPLIVYFPDDLEPVHTTWTIRPSPR